MNIEEQRRRQALQMGMLSGGLNLLAQSGPRPFHMGPSSVGSALGNAGMAGLQTYAAMAPKPKEPKWETVKVREGDEDVTYAIDHVTGQQRELGRGRAFKPSEAKTVKGADGYNYWLTGDKKGERVLPGVEAPAEDHKTYTDVNGFKRWLTGPNAFQRVNPDVRKEYAPNAPGATQVAIQRETELRSKVANGTATQQDLIELSVIKERRAAGSPTGYGTVPANTVNTLAAEVDNYDRGANLVLGVLNADDSTKGFLGSARRGFQTLAGVGGDITSIFPQGKELVDEGQRIAASLMMSGDLSAKDVSDFFNNETVNTGTQLENAIGLIYARAQFGNGRIPVEVIKRSIADVQITGLKSAEAVNQKLQMVLDMIQVKRADAASRLGALQRSETLSVPPPGGGSVSRAMPGLTVAPGGEPPPLSPSAQRYYQQGP